MDQELDQRLKTLETKIDAAYQAANKTRKYLLWTLIISLLVIFLPLIGLVFVIPQFLNTLNVYQTLL